MSLFARTTIEKKTSEPPDLDTRRRILETRKLCSEMVIQIPYRTTDGINPKFLEYAIPWVNSGIALMPIKDCFGGFIDILRAHMVKEFLRDSDRRWLVMIDNDVIPRDAESPIRLCGNDLPVCSGIACSFRPGTGIFACVGIKDKTGVARFPTTMDTKVMPAYGTREIESCGAGILAIRRDVLETIKGEPFLLPQDLRIEAVGIGMLRKTEDIYFADQVRSAGYKLHADFSVQCFHDKVFPLHWPTEHLDENLDPKDWDVTASALAVERR